MIDISHMILASTLANLSSTESASGGDPHQTMERANSRKDSRRDSGHASRWRRAGHHCRPISSDSREAGGELLTKKTLKAEQS